MKIAIITCYDQNDYVRASGLRTAFAACDDVETLVIKNRHKGLLRYLEVPLKILQARLTQHIDAYVITFRGYEMLLCLRLTFARKPIIFDEMINFVEYYQEHNKLRAGSLPDKLLRRFYRWQIRRCACVLADTPAHATFSAQLTGVPINKFVAVPIAADETIFYPQSARDAPKEKKQFSVFYYGNGMTPLHGLQYVLDAAVLLKNEPAIHFHLIGGHAKAQAACSRAAAQGARVTYEAWVPFAQIPQLVRAAGLCLGGPFGKTLQSQFVVTGKTTQFLACAAPVLVGKNKVSGMFTDKLNCLLVPPADAPAIAEAVLWAAAHPKKLQAIGVSGRKLYEQHFSQRIVNSRVRDIVQDLRHD